MLKFYLLGIVGSAAVRVVSRDDVISILEKHADSLRGSEKWSKDSNDWVLLEGIMKVASYKEKCFSLGFVVPFARDILQSGQNPNVAVPEHFAHIVKRSTTPLCNAVYFRQQGVVRELLMANADPNLCQKHYYPLRLCTFRDVFGFESFRILADLLDAGARISEDDLTDAKTKDIENLGTPSFARYDLLAYSFHVLQACRKNEKLQLKTFEDSHQYFDIHPRVFSIDETGQCALSYALKYKNIQNIIFCLRHGLKSVQYSRFQTADRVPASSFRVRMLLKLLFPLDRIRVCAMLIKSCKSFLSKCSLFRILPHDLVIKCILTPDVVRNLKTVDHILRHNEDIAMMRVSSKRTLGQKIQQIHEAVENHKYFLPRLKLAINRYGYFY